MTTILWNLQTCTDSPGVLKTYIVVCLEAHKKINLKKSRLLAMIFDGLIFVINSLLTSSRTEGGGKEIPEVEHRQHCWKTEQTGLGVSRDQEQSGRQDTGQALLPLAKNGHILRQSGPSGFH